MTTQSAPRWRRVLDSRVVAGGLILASVIDAVAAFRAEADASLRPWPVLGLWLSSIVLLLAGTYVLERGRRRSRMDLRFSRGELAFLIVVTLAALLIRTVALATLPDTFSGDEGETGDWARAVLEGELRDPFSTGWAAHPMVWFFLQALSLQVFGDTVFGLRMLSALLGAAAVPAVYLFARQPFGRPVAAFSAVLLLALHVHVHYSRVGLNSVGDPLLMLIALGFLLAGLRSGSPFRLVAAGVAAGVAQHFYLGSRLVPLVLLAVVLHQLAFNRSCVAASVRYLPLGLLGFLVAYGPGLRLPLYHWNYYEGRLRTVGVFQSGWFEARREQGDSVLEIFRHQASQSLGAFTHVADHSPDYLSEMPLLDAASAVFFVLGIGFSLLAWRRAETAAVLTWLAGTVIFGGLLLVDSPQSHRYVTAAPPACILVAVAIVRTTSLFDRLVPASRATASAFAAVITVSLAAWNLNFYFREYTPRYMYGGFHSGEEVTAMGRYLSDEGPGSFVYLFGAPTRFLNVGTIRFLAPDVTGADVHERLTRIQDLSPASGGRRPLFVFLPGRLSELSVVRNAYPDGVTRVWRSKVDRAPLFYAYEPHSQ